MAHAVRPGHSISSIPFGFDRHGRRVRSSRRVRDLRLRTCWAYPLVDGPGVALLVFFPPFLAIMALPALDLVVQIRPDNALSPVTLLILPFTLPLLVSTGLTVGYLLLFLGRVLTSSALEEEDHPRFPIWNRVEILEELGRWVWAGLMGLAIGGLPAVAFWVHCGDLDWLDWFFFLDLVVLGLAYAQMALVAALFHNSILAANPVTVVRSIARIGWDYLGPCLITTILLLIATLAWWAVLLHAPGAGWGVLGLWGCWVLTLYEAMVLTRMLGFLYAQNAHGLKWFGAAERG